MPENSPTQTYFYILDEIQLLFSKRKQSSRDCYRIMRLMQFARDFSHLVFYIPDTSFCIDIDGIHRMAKPDFNLIDYRLSDAEMDAFDDYAKASKLTITQIFSELANMGYKISFTFVTSSEAWCVSITGTKDAKFNSGATLTTWSDDSMEGAFMAYFKVTEVFQRGVWKTKTQSRRG
jgi:hypothetical protein